MASTGFSVGPPSTAVVPPTAGIADLHTVGDRTEVAAGTSENGSVTASEAVAATTRSYRRRSADIGRMLLLVVVVLATLTVLTKHSAPAPIETVVAGSTGTDVVAANVVASLKSNEKVQAASGAYLAGSGIILRIAVKNVPASETAAWLAGALAPMASILGALPTRANEQLLALVDGGGTTSTGRIMRVAFGRVADPSAYAVALSVQADVATTASTVKGPIGSPTTAQGAAVTTTLAKTTTTNTTIDTTTTTRADGKLTDNFTDDTGSWKPLAGRWRVSGGVYKQLDTAGYDLIAQWNVEPPAAYSFRATVKADADPLAGGLVLNQPKKGSRQQTSVVDLIKNGATLRWGHYDDTSTYVPDGNVDLSPAPTAASGAVLRADVTAGVATIYLADKQVATFVLASKTGGVGLAVSQAAVSFDDVSLAPL